METNISSIIKNEDTNEVIINDNNDKKINIVGTSTRYKIKKATYKLEYNKERTDIKTFLFPDDYFIYDKQLSILKNIFNELPNIELKYINVIKQIEKKIYGYKQQDIKKNNLEPQKFIYLNLILNKLVESNLTCYYCSCKMFLLYKVVRENKQWSIDRIDNNYGHNIDNVVLSCLECNLKRRCTNKNKFEFTKQLKIHRIE